MNSPGHDTRRSPRNPTDEGMSDTKVLLTRSERQAHPCVLPRQLVANPLMNKRSLVCIVDDNESVRESLPDLVEYGGYDVLTFASGEEFLESETVDDATCL